MLYSEIYQGYLILCFSWYFFFVPLTTTSKIVTIFCFLIQLCDGLLHRPVPCWLKKHTMKYIKMKNKTFHLRSPNSSVLLLRYKFLHKNSNFHLCFHLGPKNADFWYNHTSDISLYFSKWTLIFFQHEKWKYGNYLEISALDEMLLLVILHGQHFIWFIIIYSLESSVALWW